MNPARALKQLLVAVCLLSLLACTQVTTVGGVRQASKEEQVTSLVSAASTYLSQQPTNPQRAKELLRRALEVDSRSAEAHHMLAMAFWMTRELDLAEDSFRKALRFKPDFTQASMNYSSFLQQQGRHAEARKHLERVLTDTLYEGRAGAFMSYGTVLFHLGHFAEASEAYKRSLALDRGNATVMLSLALTLFQMEDYAQAERYYRQFRLNGQQTSASLLLGIRLADKLGDADAKVSYEMALRNLFPDSAEARQYFSASGSGKR